MFGLTAPLSKVALGGSIPRGSPPRASGWPRRCWPRSPAARCAPRRAARRRLGRAGYGAMVVLQNFGVERTSVTHAAIIFGAVPVLVAAGSVLAGRAASGPAAWSGFGGGAGRRGPGGRLGGKASPAGEARGASAVLGSALIVVQGELLEGRDPVAVTAVQMAAAARVLAAVRAADAAAHGARRRCLGRRSRWRRW